MAKTALVTGVSDESLKATVPEAERWDELLRTSFGFTTTLWRDGEVTLTAVITKLEALLDAANAEDQIVFVYCGHGDTLSAGGGLGEEALLLYDEPLRETRFAAVVKDHYRRGTFTVILEACFSGGFEPLWPGVLLDWFLARFGFARTKFASPPQPRDLQESFDSVIQFGDMRFMAAEQKRPLVIAACDFNELAAQVPTAPRAPLHMWFSKSAIPYLSNNTRVTPRKFREDLNPIRVDQHITFNGDLSHVSNQFFT